MIQEKDSYLTYGVYKELLFPIGYIFEWSPVIGSAVDLTTPKKVHDFFGFGTWKLYEPDVFYKCAETDDENDYYMTTEGDDGILSHSDESSTVGVYYDPYLYSNDMEVDKKYIYGNVNLMKRQRLYWTAYNLRRFEGELESWGLEPESGSYSTVYGGCNEFEGVEVAYTPIRQTEAGPVMLTKSDLESYITELLTRLSLSGIDWTTEDLYKIDEQKLIAGVGDDAISIGEEMHYVSEEVENNKNQLVSDGGNWTIYDESSVSIVSGGTFDGHHIKTYQGNKEELPAELQNCSALYEAYDDIVVEEGDEGTDENGNRVYYAALTQQPDDWEGNYSSYYTRSGSTYTHVNSETTPEFTSGVYYIGTSANNNSTYTGEIDYSPAPYRRIFAIYNSSENRWNYLSYRGGYSMVNAPMEGGTYDGQTLSRYTRATGLSETDRIYARFTTGGGSSTSTGGQYTEDTIYEHYTIDLTEYWEELKRMRELYDQYSQFLDALIYTLMQSTDNARFDSITNDMSDRGDIAGDILDQLNALSQWALALKQTKQDKLTFDSAPTKASMNPVKSKGIAGDLEFKTTSMRLYKWRRVA